MHLLVNPTVLRLPDPVPDQAAASNQVEHFFINLLKWNEFIRTNRGNYEFCMTQVCRNALGMTYPSRNSLTDLVRRTNNHVLDANTGYNACHQLLTAFAGWPYFEEIVALPLDTFAFDDDDMCLDPDLVQHAPEEIAESLQETFAYVAYARKIDKNPIALNLLLLTYPIVDSDKIEIDVHLLVGGSEVDDSEEWQHTQTDLPIIGAPDDLLRLKNLTDIWEDTRQTINRAVMLCKEDQAIDEDAQLSPYTVAPEFNDSLRDCQFHTQDRRLDRCFKKIARLLTETLSQQEQRNTREHKPLFEGRDRNGIQKTTKVNGRVWTAWRLRITSGGNAYRLHYWHSAGEYILSNVVPHDGVNINAISKNIVSQIKRNV